MSNTNSTHKCFPPRAPQEGPPLFQHGDIVFQAHDVGWIISAFFTLVATITSFWLINKHLQWYTNKHEQRYIVRLLFMVPIYATISLASYLFWNHSTPLLLIRDAYEAILLTAFFYLLLTYLSADPDEQKAIFRKEGLSRENDAARERRGQPPKKWVFPLGFIKWKPQDGLYFLQLMKWGVLQYCVVRPVTTLAAVILNYIGWYCEESWSPAWGHIWVSGIISISVTVAMYCLLQLYLSVATELAPHRPVLKMLSVKAVVFLTFWQAIFLSMLSMFGVVKDTPYMTAEDINIGWGAILETLEMAIFAFVHIKAFSYRPYKRSDTLRTPRLRSLGHAMDFRETFRELRAGWVYMWHRVRGIETDTQARREGVHEDLFGKTRVRAGEKVEVGIAVDKIVDVGGERQWLGVGDEHGYGLGRRQLSEGLEVQIEKELTKRGYITEVYNQETNTDSRQDSSPVRRHRSWWRNIYDRVSQSNPDHDPDVLSQARKARPRSMRDAEQRAFLYDDLPPPSIIKTYRDRRGSRDSASAQMQISTDFRASAEWYSQPSMHTIAESSTPPRTQTQPPPMVRSDSLFVQLFPHGLPDSGHSHPAPRPSSQSHNTQVRLGPSWTALQQTWDAGRSMQPNTSHPVSTQSGHASPMFMPAPSSEGAGSKSSKEKRRSKSRSRAPPEDLGGHRRRSSHRRESAHHHSPSPSRAPSLTRSRASRQHTFPHPRGSQASLCSPPQTYSPPTANILPTPLPNSRQPSRRERATMGQRQPQSLPPEEIDRR